MRFTLFQPTNAPLSAVSNERYKMYVRSGAYTSRVSGTAIKWRGLSLANARPTLATINCSTNITPKKINITHHLPANTFAAANVTKNGQNSIGNSTDSAAFGNTNMPSQPNRRLKNIRRCFQYD